MKENMKRSLVLALLLVIAGAAWAIPWPLYPRNQTHPIGNNWGEYQDYGTGPYYHNGVDVFPQHQGDPVIAVAHGWVKAWGTIEAQYHYRMAISDSPPSVARRCPGWLYAHIDASRTHKAVGAEVNEGDTIGYLVPWPVTGFDHTHFARISDTGTTWNRFPDPTWWFTDNPLLFFTPLLDTVLPTIQDARTGQRFAVCHNNTDSYFNDLNNITGDVDIVVRAYDKTGVPTSDPTWDKLLPYKYVWSAQGSVAGIPPTLGIINSGWMPAPFVGATIPVEFKDASPCQSLGDYDNRDYFVVATNNADGDSTIEITDTAGCWHTGAFPDDYYWIKISVSDVVGNVRTDSMRVRTNNGVGVAEKGRTGSWHNLNVPTVTRAGSNLALSLNLPQGGIVRLDLFDLSGRLEQTAFAGELCAGLHSLSFSPKRAGIHLLVLTEGQDRIVHKMTVVQ